MMRESAGLERRGIQLVAKARCVIELDYSTLRAWVVRKHPGFCRARVKLNRDIVRASNRSGSTDSTTRLLVNSPHSKEVSSRPATRARFHPCSLSARLARTVRRDPDPHGRLPVTRGSRARNWPVTFRCRKACCPTSADFRNRHITSASGFIREDSRDRQEAETPSSDANKATL
jgi:hypothetical protein